MSEYYKSVAAAMSIVNRNDTGMGLGLTEPSEAWTYLKCLFFIFCPPFSRLFTVWVLLFVYPFTIFCFLSPGFVPKARLSWRAYRARFEVLSCAVEDSCLLSYCFPQPFEANVDILRISAYVKTTCHVFLQASYCSMLYSRSY
jgi:hypothetical protein